MERSPAVVCSRALSLKSSNGALDHFLPELLVVAGLPEIIGESREDSSLDSPGEGARRVPESPDGLVDHGGHLDIVRHGAGGQDDSVI